MALKDAPPARQFLIRWQKAYEDWLCEKLPAIRGGPVSEVVRMASDRIGWAGWSVLANSARTALAALVSLLVARLFLLPEAYWAAITTLAVTQSSLGAARRDSWQRFGGTALGAVVGAIGCRLGRPQLLLFGTSVLVLGLVCAVARLDRNAHRFGSITLAIVWLVPRGSPAWEIAFHRFAEVSIGLAVALILSAVWPERKRESLDKAQDWSSRCIRSQKGISAKKKRL